MHRHQEAVIDAAVPVLVGAVIVVGEVLHGGHSTQIAPVALGVGAAGVLWARRRWPVWTLLASGALVALLFHFDRSASAVAVLAPAVALYSLALRRGRHIQLLAGLAAVTAVLLVDVLHSGRPGILQTLGHVLLVAIPLLAAEQVRTHRSYVLLLTERLKLADRAREQEAERRAQQERMRIARELHDVVSHTLTEINVHAAATAERVQPGEARSALEKIEDASHSAIAEVRGILGLLRDSASTEPPRSPAPGLERVPELVGRARDTGLDVELSIQGESPARLSDASSLAAYRIVQESLTNARRHAPGVPVRITLAFDSERLSIAVRNRTPDELGNGHRPGVGIQGMSERAMAIGGSLHAGPTADGFIVDAQLPYQPGR